MSVAHAVFVALIWSFTLLSGWASRTNVLRCSVFLENEFGRLPLNCSFTTQCGEAIATPETHCLYRITHHHLTILVVQIAK